MNKGRTMHAAVAGVLIVMVLLAGCADKPEKMVGSAKEYLAKNDRKAAIIQLRNALQTNPDLAEARFLLGKALLDTGDPATAEKELRKARELGFANDQVAPALARAVVAQGALKKAIDEFGRTQVAMPEGRAELATTLAQAKMATGDMEGARAGLAAAQAAVPGYPPALLGEARLKLAAGDLAGAMALAETVVGKTPAMVEGWQLKGDVASTQKQFDTAQAAYRKALELRPDYLPAHWRVVSMLIHQGKTDDAKKQLAAAEKIAPRNPQTLYLQAMLAFRERQYVAAREAIQKQLQVAPDNLPGLVLDGSIEYHLGSYAQAERSLLKALQQAPDQRLARMMLVNTYLRNRQGGRALEVLKPMLEQSEDDSDVMALAGEVYVQNGDMQEAERFFAKAAALDPNDVTKRTALALSHLAMGDGEQGFQELEAVAATDPGIRADLALISANVRQRKYEAALTAIAALEKKQPDKSLPHNMRGAVLAAKGDTTAARRSFERALALDPANFAAAANLARLDIAEKKLDDARKRFEGVLAKDPKNLRALLALAELRAGTGGKPDEVAALIGKAVVADPSSTSPRLVLISYYLSIKEPKKAVAAAQDALAALPDRADLLEAAGQAQFAAGDNTQALAAYKKLAQVRPASPVPHMRMAGVQLAAKDPEGARQSLKRALAVKPDFIDAQRAMIKVDLDAGRVSDAVVVAREVQKQRPKESTGYALEGEVYLSKQAWGDAVAAYRKGLKNVGTTDLAVQLDAALRAGGSVADADKFAAGWIRDHPRDAGFRAYLAEKAIGRNDFVAAAAQYRAVLEIQPNNALTLNNLAYAAGQLKDPKAIEYAERANKLAPNNAAILDTLGMLLVERGETKRGVEALQRAATLAPSVAVIRLNLVRALIKDGQKDVAKNELDALAKLGDKFPAQAEVAKLRQGL